MNDVSVEIMKLLTSTLSNGLLYEMLQQSKSGNSRSSWKIFIMYKVTLKMMSHSCKMADITDQGVSLVDHFRRREPLPSMDAIFFIQPSKENVFL
ncbi:hypothetical protein CASFOL_034189 [Castilleja foliolosa]|uniref:Uncharacterized protein n=1 Tax=Castilleja foliolosa TaxID=1961234 RepID=A0ABD3BXQ6_9LAMI